MIYVYDIISDTYITYIYNIYIRYIYQYIYIYMYIFYVTVTVNLQYPSFSVPENMTQ